MSTPSAVHHSVNPEERYRELFDHSLDVILVVSAETGKVLRANETVRRLLGYDPREVEGTRYSNLFPEDSEVDATSGRSVDDLHAHGSVLASQPFVRADGTVTPMDVTATVVPWGDEEGILITARDVSERLHAEREQESLIRELDAFAHTVAHDLKTPLTIVMAASELALESHLSADQRATCMAQSAKGAAKMGQIIDELLLLARVRITKVETRPIDMAAVVAEAVQRNQPEIDSSGATVSVGSEWPAAVGYGPWIEEVWANYLSNALRYGGDPARIEVGGQATLGGHARFWVRDHGPGIALDDQKKLFTPFVHLAARKGHGLGLSIVQRIVEKLGGTVGIESAPGDGAAFTFTLPLV